jgi:drug/metabolite transporter (DMT)-like permease
MKVLTRDHSITVILVWSAVLGFVLSIPGAVITWRLPTLTDFLLLCAMGAIATANQACYIKGMALGDAGAMAPIDYTRLVFTAAIGFLVFHEVPGVWTLVGAGIVVAATLFITLREQQLARSAKLSAEPDA